MFSVSFVISYIWKVFQSLNVRFSSSTHLRVWPKILWEVLIAEISSWLHFFLKVPSFRIQYFLTECVWGVFSGMVVSVGGMSHGECLWRHLLFKHREHIMSIYDWSGAKLYDRRRWRDYVKCHTAREGTERCGLFGCIYMGTLSWTAELFTMRKTVPVILVGQTWCSQR